MIAARGDDLGGTQVLGYLDGHAACIARGAENEDVLPLFEGHATTQREPRPHRRVHGSGDGDGIDVTREHETAVDLDHRLVGHGTHQSVVEHEVTELAIRAAADAVDARNEREHAGARVVRPIRLRANARMQADGEHVDEHLAAAFRLRGSEIFLMRWHLE